MPDSIEKNKRVINAIVEKLFLERQRRPDKLPIMTFDYLYGILDETETGFVKEFLKINPADYGKRSPRLDPPAGGSPVPKNLKKIKGQKYTWKGEEKQISTQYLPKNAYKAYKKLNAAIKKELGRPLLIKSAYRSPAYQVLTFFYSLVVRNDWDFGRTMQSVAFPGYSEHGYPPHQAIDFITQDGISFGPEKVFDETEEYKWLLKNAQKFGFYLSYPKNNEQGIEFEPWHWHYENKI